MATLLDDQVGIAKESVYGTAVTVSRFYPYLDDNEGTWDPRNRQGDGLRGGSGRHSMLSARAYPTIGQGSVTVAAELESKQAGILLEAALGVLTVTAVTGGSQQLAHPGITGTYLPSYTIQLAKIQNNGTVRTETYRGCTASKVKIEQPEDGIATIEVEFDAAGYTTVTALATASYATNPVIFDAYQAVCSIGTTGLTVPTTTVLASGLTASTEFREWSIELDHKIDDSDWKLSTRGRPVAGLPDIKWKATADFDSNTIPDWYVAGTQVAWYSTHTTTEPLSASYTQLQVVAPKILLTGDLPTPKRGETRTTKLTGEVKWDGTNQDLYVAYRTTDVAA